MSWLYTLLIVGSAIVPAPQATVKRILNEESEKSLTVMIKKL